MLNFQQLPGKDDGESKKSNVCFSRKVLNTIKIGIICSHCQAFSIDIHGKLLSCHSGCAWAVLLGHQQRA